MAGRQTSTMSTIEILLAILNFLLGFAAGGVVPAGLLYLVFYIKRNEFTWKLLFKVLLRVFGIVAALFFCLLLIGLLPSGSVEQSISDLEVGLLGGGFFIGLLVGTVIFLKGLLKAIRTRKQKNEAV